MLLKHCVYIHVYVCDCPVRSAVDPGKTTCMLYLQADHLFYERIGSEEACIESITRHVQRVNSIYKVTGNSHKIRTEGQLHLQSDR